MKAGKETISSNRNGAIDFLRFAASFILVLHHYQQVHNVFIDNGINFYSGHFYWGLLVDLFFVISGYFLLGSAIKIHDGDLKFKEYYLHRCVRLLPLVGVTAIIYFSSTTTYISMSWVNTAKLSLPGQSLSYPSSECR